MASCFISGLPAFGTTFGWLRITYLWCSGATKSRNFLCSITSLRVLLGLQPLTTTAYPLRVDLAGAFCQPSRMALPMGELHEKRKSQSLRGFSWKHKRSTEVFRLNVRRVRTPSLEWIEGLLGVEGTHVDTTNCLPNSGTPRRLGRSRNTLRNYILFARGCQYGGNYFLTQKITGSGKIFQQRFHHRNQALAFRQH